MSKRTAGKTATATQNRYIQRAYDRINLLVPKGDKEVIQDRAVSQGESTNAYIVRAISERMQREAGDD